MTRATSALLLIFAELMPAASWFGYVPPAIEHGAWDRRRRCPIACLSSSEVRGSALDPPPDAIDRQSDARYDRGLAHISADLHEDDVVAYQSGTWYVDGTEVGKRRRPVTVRIQPCRFLPGMHSGHFLTLLTPLRLPYAYYRRWIQPRGPIPAGRHHPARVDAQLRAWGD